MFKNERLATKISSLLGQDTTIYMASRWLPVVIRQVKVGVYHGTKGDNVKGQNFSKNNNTPDTVYYFPNWNKYKNIAATQTAIVHFEDSVKVKI